VQSSLKPPVSSRPPQATLLFQVVAFFSRLQLHYLLPRLRHPERAVLVFVLLEGSAAVAVIASISYLTDLPLIFPSLGPSAFILFRMPMSASAAPRSVFVSHTLGLAAGFVALALCRFLPGLEYPDPGQINGSFIMALSVAMALASFLMIRFNCNHPPAIATSLIVAMGSIATPVQAGGFVLAIGLLIFLAFLFNRILGGLPFPFWKHDPAITRHFGSLAGIPESGRGYWQELASQIFHLQR